MSTAIISHVDNGPGLSATIHSERTKLFSVRSFYITIIATLIISAVAAMIIESTLSRTRKTSLDHISAFDVFTAPLLGVDGATLVIIIASAIFFGSEFTKKQGIATFSITPNRQRVLIAKIIVFAQISIFVAICSEVISAGIGRMIAAKLGAHLVNLFSPETLRVLGGSALQPIFYSIVVGLCAIIFRNIAGAIAAGYCLIIVLPAFADFLPRTLADIIAPIFPRAGFDTLAGVAKANAPFSVPIWWAICLLLLWLIIIWFLAVRALRNNDV